MSLPVNLQGIPVHLIGIKGTGMCALAEVLVAAGAAVSGSDVGEEFYTDAILRELGVDVLPFDAASLGAETTLVIRSAAYDRSNPVVAEALDRSLPVITYPEALGSLSDRFDSSAVAGVHGKTTTTAMCGALLKACGLPATVVAGSAVSAFGDRSTWNGGDRYLVAETCEYRRHFLHFHPKRIVLTSIEPDHQDYYPDLPSIMGAFREFLLSLPPGGTLIFCTDDAGAGAVAADVGVLRPDIRMIPYGASADGTWKVTFGPPAAGRNTFRVAAFDIDFHLALPGRHLVLDAVAAMILTVELGGTDAHSMARALADFRGSRRRSEIIGEAGGVLVMDDYGHHPTAIRATLRGIRDFHPDRRIVVDFIPHTFSRTAALIDDFADCFSDADLLILHPIYASARETDPGNITGRDLWNRASGRRGGHGTLYCETLDSAAEALRAILEPGDLFITMGAGNNRPLGLRIFEERQA